MKPNQDGIFRSRSHSTTAPPRKRFRIEKLGNGSPHEGRQGDAQLRRKRRDQQRLVVWRLDLLGSTGVHHERKEPERATKEAKPEESPFHPSGSESRSSNGSPREGQQGTHNCGGGGAGTAGCSSTISAY
jgi:hypothetical protein